MMMMIRITITMIVVSPWSVSSSASASADNNNNHRAEKSSTAKARRFFVWIYAHICGIMNSHSKGSLFLYVDICAYVWGGSFLENAGRFPQKKETARFSNLCCGKVATTQKRCEVVVTRIDSTGPCAL